MENPDSRLKSLCCLKLCILSNVLKIIHVITQLYVDVSCLYMLVKIKYLFSYLLSCIQLSLKFA